MGGRDPNLQEIPKSCKSGLLWMDEGGVKVWQTNAAPAQIDNNVAFCSDQKPPDSSGQNSNSS